MNKKGFTMIELLAVITLLGILTIIAIPSVRTLIEKGKKNYYATQRNQVELAAKEYLKDNPKLLPGEIGGTTEVNLQDLIDHKYISRVKDQDKADCDTQATKVKVTRTAKRKYKYEVILNCPNYKDEEKTNNKDGRIEFTVQNLNVKNNQSTITDFKVKITIKGKKVNGQAAAIKYYKYRILSGNAVLEEKEYEVLTSTVEKTVNLTEYVKRSDVTTLTIELTAVTVDNHKEVYKQSVSAIDTTAPLCPGAYEGTTIETRDGNIYLKDKDGNILIKTRAGWSQDPQTVTIYCYDKDNYGSKTKCKNAQYTKTFKNDTDITKGFIMQDMMGNESGTCTIPNNMVKIDNTPPTIELRMKALSYDAPEPADIAPHNNSNPIYNEDWFSGKIFTKMYAEDNPPTGSGYSGKPTSGVAHYYVTTTGKDKPNDTHVEKQSKMLLGEGTSTIKYEVCDEAGNCATSRDYTIKIDRTAPEITMSSWKYTTETKPTSHSGLDPYTNDTWFKGRIFTDVVQADKNGEDGSNDASGIKTTKYTITGKGASSGTGTSKEVTAEGTSQIKYNVCDNAGNCRDSNSMTVKLDRTAPTTSVTMYKVNGTTKPSSTSGLSTYSNNTWFSGSVYVVARSQEGADTSGVAEIKYTTTGKTGAASNVSGGRTNAGEVKDFSVNNFITQEGTSTINYNACDMVGNCANSSGGAKTIKLDRTAPQITMSAWKYTSETKPTSHDGLESYTSGTWLKGRVYTDVVQSDPNGTDGSTDSSGIKTTKVDITGKGATLLPQTGTSAVVTAEGTSTIRYNVCDNANNCRDSNESIVKLDRTAPTTTVTMYKVNGTTKPSSTSGLSTYSNNTWYSGSVYLKATANEGSDTSGVKAITYTTSGKTGTANNSRLASTASEGLDQMSGYSFISAEGTSTIVYNACDTLGNCQDSTLGERTIKLDRTAPSCSSTYTSPSEYNGGWTKENVSLKGTCSESGDVSGCGTFTSTATNTIREQTNNTYTPGIVKDNAGNEKECPKLTVKIDKTAPTVPTNKLYKKNSANNVSSSAWLSEYSNNTWIDGYVFTQASGSTDSGGAGGVNYYYKTTGAVGSATDQSGSYKNINEEGKSTIQYKACDNVGNCSNYSSASTILLDRTAPTCTTGYSSPSGYSGGWTNQNVTVQGTCNDAKTGVNEVSGCQGNTTLTYNSNTNTTSARPAAVKDNAGHSTTCGTTTVKIDKTAPTCTTTYTAPSGYAGGWTKDDVTLQGKCSDTGGSGCTGDKTTPYSSDTNASLSPGSVSDGAGNSVTCPSKTVKIDKTGPTGLTVKLYKLKWILCTETTFNNGTCKHNQTEFVSGNNGASAGLETYTPGSWYNVGVHTEASGATDAGVGGPIKYYFTTRGKTTNVTNEERSWRNNDSEGESTIYYTACDSLGNCTNSPTYKMMLDKTDPKATVEIVSRGVCPSGTRNAGKTYCEWKVKGTGTDVTSNGVQSGVESVVFFAYSCNNSLVHGNTVTNTCHCYDGHFKNSAGEWKKSGQANFIVTDKAGNRNDIWDPRIPTGRDENDQLQNLWNVKFGVGQSVTDYWADFETCSSTD